MKSPTCTYLNLQKKINNSVYTLLNMSLYLIKLPVLMYGLWMQRKVTFWTKLYKQTDYGYIDLLVDLSV